MSPVHRSSTRYWRPRSWSSRSARATMLVQLGRRLLGGGVGEQLDLVELVDPEQAPGVPAGGPGLAAEAGGGGGEPEGEDRLLQDVAPPHRGERHLGRRDGPQVVPLEVVGLLLELGEVARWRPWSRSAPWSGAGPPRSRRRGCRGRTPTAPGSAGPRSHGRGGTSSPTAWPRAPCRAGPARRRSPSGAPAGRRRRRAARPARTGPRTLSSGPSPSGASGAGRLGR